MQIQRSIHIRRQGIDLEARTVPATIATDAAIFDHATKRPWILRHEEDSITFPEDGLGVIATTHNDQVIPVARARDLTVADGRTESILYFGESQSALDILRDIANGTITDVSIGADIEKKDIDELPDGTIVANRWTADHVAIVASGADPAAKIHRESKPMAKFTVVDSEDSGKERISVIRELFTGLDSPDWQKMQIDALSSDDTIEVVRAAVLKKLKDQSQPVDTGERTDVQLVRDSLDKWKEGMSAVMLHRTGIYMDDREKNEELRKVAASSEFFGYSLLEMARSYLKRINVDTTGMNAGDVAYKACVTRAAGIISHSPGDFANLVADTQNKVLAQAYEQTPTTFQIWTGTGSQPDFKQADIVNTSSFSDVDVIDGDEEYRYGTLADKKEVAQLQTRGKLISVGRRLIVNDDLGGITRTTSTMARAMARAINADVYSLLATGATDTMNEDGVALFDAATHGNFVAGGGGAAPTVATLDTAFTSMATQTALAPGDGTAGATLNLQPTYLIVPRALEWTARALLDNQQDPAEGGTTSFTAVNPFRGRLQVVADAEIDGDDAAKWYLAASPTQIDTITVFYLNGVQSPTLMQEEGFTRDGVTFKIRHDWDAAVLDWRGLYHNDGN